ncbi:hypothetical protein ACVINW_003848 [Bradyrhizobium sp. USDA 4461]
MGLFNIDPLRRWNNQFLRLAGQEISPLQVHPLFTLRPTASQEMTIAVTRHPFGASQMSVESTARAIGLKDRINTKHNARDFAPICIIRLCIEKAQVGNDVLLIVWHKLRRAGRHICDLRIGRHSWNS